jgi:exodeoxyribonuclease-3
MHAATFNCNSVRARLGHILDWLEAEKPDLLALQETKAADADFPASAFEEAGWHAAYRGEKKYNGIAVLTREPPEAVRYGLGDDEGQSATRLIHVRCGGVEVVNTYVPQGRELGSEQFVFKLEWLMRLKRYFAERFDPDRDEVLWLGDLNVAPAPEDVYDSKAVWPHVCHCEEVIESFERVRRFGFEDVFRKHLPGAGHFTFWDYRAPKALERNRGWRIDHVLATPPLAARSTQVAVDRDLRRREKPSDHTVVSARFDH